MDVKSDIQKTIKVLKQLRKFKSQAEIAEYLGYNASYFSRALNTEIPMELEDTFFRAFPKSIYLNKPDTVTEKIKRLEAINFQPMENAKQIDEGDDYIWLETTKIPERVGLSLSSNYFAESMLNELEKGKIRVKKNHKGKYWEVEATGDSMNDNTSRSLLDGDWYAARDIPREAWKNKLHFNGWNAFYFLHNERGHFIKEVVSHDPETGIIELRSWNPDKETYPNFTINIKDCYIIANIVKLINRDYNIFYK